MKREKVSELTTNRLSVYLRCLNMLLAANVTTVSSQRLAEEFNLNSAQIRKDLAHFGEFGVRGVGYDVRGLRDHLTSILGLDRPHRVAIIGAGNLGSALAGYYGWSASNFSVVALFDSDQDKIGLPTGATNSPVVQPMANFQQVVEDEAIDVAVIAVPGNAAQGVLNVVMDAGIKAVLNFAPARLHARPGVKIKTVDLTVSLETLSYFLARQPAPFVGETGNGAFARRNGAGEDHVQ